MALDAHVMPLWRFKAGVFTSPIENSLGLKPDVIALADVGKSRIPWYQRLLTGFGVEPEDRAAAGLLKRKAAETQVEKLKTEISGITGSAIDWPDEGSNHYSGQFYHPIEMRAFAAWHDHRDKLPVFEPAPEDDYYKHPVWACPKPDRRRFPTLVDHCLHTGYLLPVLFEGVHKVEPFTVHNHWTFYHHVASSHVMLDEVTDFLAFLSEFGRPGRSTFSQRIQWYAQELQNMCQLSLKHQLPVIFHG